MKKFFPFLIILGIIFINPLLYAQDTENNTNQDLYSLDKELEKILSEDKKNKKRLSINSEITLSSNFIYLNKDSLLFKQKYYKDLDKRFTFYSEFNSKFMLEYKKDNNIFYIRPNLDLYYKEDMPLENNFRLDEAYILLQPNFSYSCSIGKKVLRWGRGYFTNIVSFFSREKDINDPEAMEEGYVLICLDYIKSFSNNVLQNISFTPVFLPIFDLFNKDFPTNKDLDGGIKLYFLIFNIDIDIMFIEDLYNKPAFGFDWAYNFSSNFETHGEISYKNFPIYSFQDQNIDYKSAFSLLLGTRYLNAYSTTFILEYYYNGHGYSKEEIKNYYSLISEGFEFFQETSNDNKLKNSLYLGKNFFNLPLIMRDYLYLKITQKEPFNILYFNPSFISLLNLEDLSANMSLDLLYSPITNLDLRFKISINLGKRKTEFGEKAGLTNLYLEGKYYF